MTDALPTPYVGIAHGQLGDTDAMFTALEEGVEERSDRMYALGTQPLTGEMARPPSLRADPGRGVAARGVALREGQ